MIQKYIKVAVFSLAFNSNFYYLYNVQNVYFAVFFFILKINL